MSLRLEAGKVHGGRRAALAGPGPPAPLLRGPPGRQRQPSDPPEAPRGHDGAVPLQVLD